MGIPEGIIDIYITEDTTRRMKSSGMKQGRSSKDTITPIRRKVVDWYMRGYTKKDCLRKAGYSESYANFSAHKIFNSPEVIKEIQRRQEMGAKKAEIDKDWIIERLKSIADADLGDILEIDEDGEARFDLTKMTPDLKRALGKFSVDEYIEGRGPNKKKVKRMRVDLLDKLRALEMLAKHLNLFGDENKATIEVNIIDKLNEGRARVATSSD